MTTYLVRRLASIVPTLVLVSMLVFGLQQLLPGDPAVILAGEDRDPSVVAYLHEKLHLDEPLPTSEPSGRTDTLASTRSVPFSISASEIPSSTIV